MRIKRRYEMPRNLISRFLEEVPKNRKLQHTSTYNMIQATLNCQPPKRKAASYLFVLINQNKILFNSFFPPENPQLLP